MSPNEQPDQGSQANGEPAPPTRRCWRCLQTFACSADDVPPGPAQWWLCDPCQASLLPRAAAHR